MPSFIDFPLDAQRQIAYAEHLTGPDGPLVGLIDMERIAVSGHSLGGYGAVAAAGAQLDFDALSNFCEESEQPDYTCDFGAHRDAPMSMMAEMLNLEEVPEGLWPAISDPRVDALVAMSPARIPAFGSEGLAVADASALILIGSGDTVEPGDSYARRAYEHWGGLEKAIVTFEHGDHMLFGDDCARMSWILDFGLFVACSDPIWDMDRAHDLINHFATAFLLAELYGDEDAATALAPEAVVFPGITYEATGY